MSSPALQDALRNAKSLEHVAEAFEAGMKAAYESGLQFGHAAAIEVLNRKDEEAPAAAVEAVVPPPVTENTVTNVLPPSGPDE